MEERRPDQVWSLEFKGNQTFSGVVLQEQIATDAHTLWEKIRFWKKTGHPVDEMQIRKDVIRIRNFYQRRGFFNVKVSYTLRERGKSWKKKLIFHIEENAAIRINEVNFVFKAKDRYADYIRENEAFQKIKQRQPLQPGRRYEKIKTPEAVGQIEDVLKNLGFAYAKVSLDARVDTARLSADLFIECQTGPRTYISEINVEGAKASSQRYVVKQSGLKIGEQYSLDKLQEAQRELFNHHLFQFVTISVPEQEHDSTLNLLLRVREAPLRSVQASVGFGTEELARGQLNWIHRNAFDQGHRFTATGRASFIQQSLNFDYLFPYFYNNKSSIVISPFLQHQLEKSFELFSGGVTNSFIYQYQENFTASSSYEFAKNLELSKKFDVSLPDTTLEYDLSSLKFNGYYNEGFRRRQTGWVIQPFIELSGLLGLATFRFQKISFDVRRFIKLGQTTTFAARLQAGGIVNAKTDSLPRNSRFFLGGTNSVRGWYRQELGPKQARVRTDSVRQNDGTFADTTRFEQYIPLGGRAVFGFNIEVRQELNNFIKGFGIAAFLDGGQVWQSIATIGNRPIQFGAGGGLRYRSPIGPLRIDVAYKLNPTREDLGIYKGQNFGDIWNRIGIHFSIGQAF